MYRVVQRQFGAFAPTAYGALCGSDRRFTHYWTVILDENGVTTAACGGRRWLDKGQAIEAMNAEEYDRDPLST